MNRWMVPILCVGWLTTALEAQVRPVPPITGEEVNRAITRGVQFLKKRQLPDGTWPNFRLPGGSTVLATLALLSSGTPVDDPVLASGLEAVAKLPLNESSFTYVVGLQATVLAQADPKKYAAKLAACVRWLVSAQTSDGLWTYQVGKNVQGRNVQQGFDNSNSQFALMGLYEAARAGQTVPPSVWTRAQKAILANQCCDGAWGYVRSQDRGYGSMTAACLMGLFLTGHQLVVSQELGYDEETGEVGRCGQYVENVAVANGLDWIALHFDASSNPGLPHGGGTWQFYWLYSAERLGMISGLRRFGGHDWYAAGVEQFIRAQRDDGSWGSDDDTCFALLFLAKGHTPLLIQKLHWSEDPQQWNVHRHDLRNLTNFLESRLGGKPVGWQSVAWSAPLEEWLAAPILFIQGLNFPDLTEAQRSKLRAYVENGGTILAEATCTMKPFDDGFRRFCRQTFPGSTLAPLPLDHPLFQTPHKLTTTWKVEAMRVGCRISVIYLPKDVSSLWDRGNVPRLSRFSFELGENIANFVAGGEPLRDRLDVVQLPPTASQPVDLGKLPRGALQIGQVTYQGPWNPHPQAVSALACFLHETANVDVATAPHPVALTDEELKATPMVYLTGYLPFEFSAAEAGALRRHLERGGFLFAAPCCEYEAFSKSFKEQMARVLPEAKFVALGPEHPILNGSLGFDLRNADFKPAGKAAQSQPVRPILEGIELNGRLVVVFTAVDLDEGLLGYRLAGGKKNVSDSVKKLAANVILYALTH